MTLRQRVRRWLGITEIQEDQDMILRRVEAASNLLLRANKSLDALAPGIGRIIAKLDTKFAESEFSPERKAESDKLAEEVIKRLNAEALARAPYK